MTIPQDAIDAVKKNIEKQDVIFMSSLCIKELLEAAKPHIINANQPVNKWQPIELFDGRDCTITIGFEDDGYINPFETSTIVIDDGYCCNIAEQREFEKQEGEWYLKSITVEELKSQYEECLFFYHPTFKGK